MGRCLACASGSTVTVLRRARVPIVQNALCRDQDDARTAATGEMALSVCDRCGFAFNAAFDPAKIVYGPGYENDQSHSSAFRRHMNEMAARVLDALPAGDGFITEVGCGQGSFLALLRAGARVPAVRLHGFDPSYRGGALPAGVAISQRFLDQSAILELGAQPKIVVLRHVIEHIPDPARFFATIRTALGSAVDAKIFVETPCFAWIASNRVLQDVFYEHVNYFTADTLGDALEAGGFTVARIEHVFGGQYLWAEAASATPTPRPARDDQSILQMASTYAADVEAQISYWRAYLADGIPTAVWGAGAKGVTFVGLVDREQKLIDCVVDVNPQKQRSFIPVTAHPIVAPAEAVHRGMRRALIMNPNYEAEIAAQITSEGLSIELVPAGDQRG